MTCALASGQESETQDQMWQCQEQQCVVIRKSFMTKKDKEEPRTEPQELAWNEAHRKEDEVCVKAAAETLRTNLGDENGETSLEQVSLCLEEEGIPTKQYTLTESGTRLFVWTDGSAFHKDMPLVAASRSGNSLCSRVKSKHSFRLQRTWRHARQSSWHSFDYRLELDNMWFKTRVEQMLSWIERKREATHFPLRTHVCVEGDVGDVCAHPKDRGWSDVVLGAQHGS